VAQVGTHIFYRWPGAWGEPSSFRKRYAGKEVDPAILRAAALMTSGLWPRNLDPVRTNVELKADPHLQLLGAVRLLANRQGNSSDSYETELRSYFAEASNAQAVQLLRAAQSDGTGDATRFADAVREFGENNDWKRFFRAHRRFYDQRISRAEGKLDSAVAAWNIYTGNPVKPSVIAVAVGPSGNLPVCLTSKSQPLAPLWIPANGAEGSAADIFLASGVPTDLLEPRAGAAAADSSVEKQVIRAVFARIEALSSGEAAGHKAVSREIGLGHALVPEIARRLTYYEHHRAEFPTLASFLPRLLEDLPVPSAPTAPIQSMDCKPDATEIASAGDQPPLAGAPQASARIRVETAAVRVRESL
jgi:hypothetical protein